MGCDKSVKARQIEKFSEPPRFNFSRDFIRTLAIFLVTLVHTTAFPYNIPDEITPTVTFNWFSVYAYGAVANVAVPLFVMLRGVLPLDLQKPTSP